MTYRILVVEDDFSISQAVVQQLAAWDMSAQADVFEAALAAAAPGGRGCRLCPAVPQAQGAPVPAAHGLHAGGESACPLGCDRGGIPAASDAAHRRAAPPGGSQSAPPIPKAAFLRCAAFAWLRLLPRLFHVPTKRIPRLDACCRTCYNGPANSICGVRFALGVPGAEQKGIRCKAGAAATTVCDQKARIAPIGPRPEKGRAIAGNRVVISQETCRASAVTHFGEKCTAGLRRVFAMGKNRGAVLLCAPGPASGALFAAGSGV